MEKRPIRSPWARYPAQQAWCRGLRGLLALLPFVLLPSGLAAPAVQLDDAVVVAVMNPLPGQQVRGGIAITGYAADRRSAGGSGLNERDIQVYLDDSADLRTLLNYAVAGQESPEAAAALGTAFDRIGFRTGWSTCAFPPGPHRLVVWVSSLVTPGARNFTTVDVEVEPCPPGRRLDLGQSAEDLDSEMILASDGTAGQREVLQGVVADFALGVDVRCLPPGEACRYGVAFRGLPGPGEGPTSGGYTFGVNPVQGSFFLAYAPPGSDDRRSRSTMLLGPQPASAIRHGFSSNRLGVVAQGDWLRLFVNGEQIGEVHADQRLWGPVGWEVMPAGRPFQAAFSHLAISTVASLETLREVLGERLAP